MNVGTPEQAFDVRAAAQPRRGPGPAGIHHQPPDRHPPQGAAEPRRAAGGRRRGDPRAHRRATTSPRDYYIKRLAEGVATIAAAFAPEPVIVRMSDFKSNEYANLIGGPAYEPHEENPMIGFRGASRYLEPSFRDCFDLECRGPVLRPQRDGPDQRQADDPVRADPGRGPRRHRTAGGERPRAAARTASR